MATYSATIQLTGGTLTVTRPYPSVEAVDDVVDSLLYSVRDDTSPVTSVGVTIVTADDTTDAPAAPVTAPDPGLNVDPGPQSPLPASDNGLHAAPEDATPADPADLPPVPAAQG